MPFRKSILPFALSILLSGIFACAEKKEHLLAPGIKYRHIYDEQGPWSINVLEIHLQHPSLHLVSVKAHNLLSGTQPTSDMAKELDWSGHRVVGGINADFFAAGGIPVGTQIAAGKIIKSPSHRPLFILTPKKNPAIEIVALQGKVICSNDRSFNLSGVNHSRNAQELILYNSFNGETTHTNKWGTEVVLTPLDQVAVGDTIRAITSHIAAATGNQKIPPDGMVLSGHGEAAQFIAENVAVQDTIALLITLPPFEGLIHEAVGGIPRIIRDGQISIEMDGQNIRESFSTNRHPRTAVGFDADSTTLFMVTVDGRQPDHSVGMTLQELAALMLKLGCYQAINLDGGGSTTMLVGTHIVNKPSDATGERAVANALMVISTTAEDSLKGLTRFLAARNLSTN
ncbi:phosphodiester glycosidase family protein [candidate division KSB1 bacterium]|nr:phosphodiester glycosidase family protein [candidate division KSB1 bacterium]